MSRRLRRVLPERYYSVTNRVHGCRYWLKPTPEIREILLTWLIRAAHLYRVEVVAFEFMSNHFHLIVRCPDANLDAFMQLFQSKAAYYLNVHWEEPGGSVFGEYDPVEITDDAALLDTLVYFMVNPVKAGLIHDCRLWPGLSSVRALLEGEPLVVRSLDRTAWHRAKKPADRSRFERELRLELAVPDCLRHLSEPERRELLRDLIERRQADLLADFARKRRRVPRDLRHLRFISHRDRPARPKRSRAPLCHASSPEARADFALEWRRYVRRYREAAERYRAGEHDVRFPRGSFHPWVRRIESRADPPLPFRLGE